MAERKTKAAPKAKAATAERQPQNEPKKVQITELGDYTFQTPIELTLPADLPATFGLDMASILAKEESGEPSIGSLYLFLQGLIGEGQMGDIRRALIDEGVSAEAVGGPAFLLELTNQVGAAYGDDSGKASDSSTDSAGTGTN